MSREWVEYKELAFDNKTTLELADDPYRIHTFKAKIEIWQGKEAQSKDTPIGLNLRVVGPREGKYDIGLSFTVKETEELILRLQQQLQIELDLIKKQRDVEIKKLIKKIAYEARLEAELGETFKIEQELLDIIGSQKLELICTLGRNDNKRQSYLQLLLRTVNDKVNDEDYNELSDEATDWCDAAVEAYKEGRKLPDFGELLNETAPLVDNEFIPMGA